MAIVFMESFDYWSDIFVHGYTRDSNSRDNYYGWISAGGGRGGSNAFMSQRGQYGAFAPFGTALSTATVGFWFNQVGIRSAEAQYNFGLMSGTTFMISYQIQQDGTMIVYRGRGTAELGRTASGLFTPGARYIETKVKIDPSVGTVELRSNGATILSLTGKNTGSGTISGFAFSASYNDSSSQDIYYDDMYVTDETPPNAGFLGDIRVEYLVPTGAGVKTQFTPSTGSNWQTVDEITTPSDTDYNSASTLGAMDLFGMQNLAGNGLVYGVQTDIRTKKDDAGHRRVKPVFYKASGSGETSRFYAGSQSPVLDTFINSPIQIYNTSPDTGVAWTVDEVNALQYGYAVGEAGMFTIDAKLV